MHTILICDDDRDIVSALKIYLTSEGYQTVEAYNGEEAVAAVRGGNIDLILMDVMMPEAGRHPGHRQAPGGGEYPHHPAHRQE